MLCAAMLLTCCLAGLVLPASAATDLLGDGDFEGTLSKQWSWTGASASNIAKYAIISDGNSPMTVVEEADGNHCLEIPELVESGASKQYDRYFYSLNVAASKTYRLTLRYKGSGLRLYFHSTYCTAGKGAPTIADSTEWKTFTREFTTAASINKNFIIAIGHKASAGTVLVDDVQLTEVIETESISFVSQSVSLEQGETEALSLVAQPDGAEVPADVTYTSSNTAVATVSAAGVVTAVADGVATITATSGSLSATCTVVVETSPVVDLIVDGDFESETLSTNWKIFTAATANVSFVTDPENADNRCMKVTGAKTCNYYALSNVQADTWYKLTYKAKGTGRLSNTFGYSAYGDYTVLGTENYQIATASNGNAERVYITPTSTWQEYSILFKATKNSNNAFNKNYIFYLGGLDSGKEVYYDDVSMVPLGVAYTAQGLKGGSLSLSDGTTVGTTIENMVDKTATITVAPQAGYLMVPGSLRYTTSGGKTYRVLNKNTNTFGEGEGNTFTFAMPKDNVRVTADFVETDTQNFAWGTIGTSVRYNGNEELDGIRFLTRVNLTAFDAEESGFSLTYDGESYTVKRLGLLLKRAANELPLTLENLPFYSNAVADERMWNVDVYTADSQTFHLTDYTDGYLDYTIAMTTKTPSEAFNERRYTARGYLVLEKGGVETVLYANERTDNVNTALARLNGEISDDVVDGNTPEVPETPTITVPEDDKDYSNADLKILSIGNSYSQDAHKYLQAMAAAEGKLFKCVNLYKSGCALKTHSEGWTSGEAIYNYELNGVTDYDTYVSLAAVLESDDFDVITLQQASWSSVNYSTFQPYLNDLITVLREKQPNAEIYLQQTWAYGDGSANHTNSPAHTGGTMAAMWEKVEAAYASAAAETGLTLIPSGQAIQFAQEALNTGNYSETSIQRDNAHVSYTWGRYLLARVWYQALTGDVPTVTLDQLNTSVTANATMEALVTEAAAAAFDEYAIKEAA